MTEEWRDIPGWEGLYQVSDQGRVKTLPRTTRGRWATPMHFKERIRKPDVITGGYLRVSLSSSGRREKVLIHRAVLGAFVGECPPGHESLHLDNNPANNRLGNLRWGTHSENIQGQVLAGNHNQGRKTHCLRGHPFDEANTRPIRTGGRACRECKRQLRRAAV